MGMLDRCKGAYSRLNSIVKPCFSVTVQLVSRTRALRARAGKKFGFFTFGGQNDPQK
jgi:hypothetical protein